MSRPIQRTSYRRAPEPSELEWGRTGHYNRWGGFHRTTDTYWYLGSIEMNEPTDGYVVTVTPTIMSGTVVRWFTSVDNAEHFRPFLSASEYEVITHVEGVTTPELREQANAVQDALIKGDRDAAKRLETHRRRGLTGPIEPLASDDSGASGGSDV